MSEQTITGKIRASSLSATIYGGFSPGESQTVLIPKTISRNGVYLPSDDNADGYSAVTVNVQSDTSVFVIKEKDNIIQYNTQYLGDVWAVYSQNETTQQNIEHIQNGSFLSGSGSIWKMSGGAIQPTATSWLRAMCFNVPFTITNETTFNLQYSYSNAVTYRTAQFSFWESAEPSTILATSFGTGTIVNDIGYVTYINNTMPTTQTTTVFTQDITALQEKTVWLHLLASDVIPLITGIWFE